MFTLQTASLITDLLMHTWFFAVGFLMSACVLSHTVRYVREYKLQRCNKHKLEQIQFFMQCKRKTLLKYCKQLNLRPFTGKKLDFATLIATYQLGY